MEDTLTPILERAKTEPYEAAQELGRGLMRGNAAEFKLGYNADAAYLATVKLIDTLIFEEMIALRHYLTGYGEGLREASVSQVNPA